jgi:hypothetical protein
MPQPKLPDDLAKQAADMYRKYGSSGGADKLGINRSTFDARVRRAIAMGLVSRDEHPKAFKPIREMQVSEPPEDDLSVDELLALKRKLFERKKAKDKWAQLIPVAVKDRQPISITVIGDPHADDDGCDIAALERDLDVPTNTPGMYLLHVGDLANWWVGRLAKKYADQITTKSQAYKLVEWMLKGRPNLAVIGGNHDMWEGGSLINWIARQGVGVAQSHGVRMALNFHGDHVIRVHARHDFPGRSQYNAAHGLRRELLFGFNDHVLLAGHTHQDTAQIVPHVTGDVSHLYRVSGYKMIDDYAEENRFIPQRFAPSVTLVLNPWHPVPVERVKPFWDVECAAEWLRFLRKKAA